MTDGPDLEPVPTVRQLAEMNEGYAVAIDWDKDGKPTKWRLLEGGTKLLGQIMARNAEATIAWRQENWTSPQSRQIPGLTHVA